MSWVVNCGRDMSSAMVMTMENARQPPAVNAVAPTCSLFECFCLVFGWFIDVFLVAFGLIWLGFEF